MISPDNAAQVQMLSQADASKLLGLQFVPGLDRVALGLPGQLWLYDPQGLVQTDVLRLADSDVSWIGPAFLYSPDGSLLALSSGNCPSDTEHCTVKVQRTADHVQIFELDVDVLSAAAISDDDRWLVLGGGEAITIWSLADSQPVVSLPGSMYMDRFSLSPDGSLLAGFVYMSEKVTVWRLPTGEPAYRLQPEAYAGAFYPNSAAFSPDGKTLAVGANGLIGLWQAADGRELRFWQPHGVEITALNFSLDGRLLITGDWDGKLVLSDVASGAALNSWQGHTGMIVRAGFAAQGRLLVTWGADGLLRLWGVPPR